MLEAAGRVRMEEAITCDSVPCFELVCKAYQIIFKSSFLNIIYISHDFDQIQDSPIKKQTRLP